MVTKYLKMFLNETKYTFLQSNLHKVRKKENEKFKAKIKSAKIEYINRVEEKLENGIAGAVW